MRNLLEPVRTFLVWATAVFIHYCISDKYVLRVLKIIIRFGEPLTVWSWLQLAGFVILSIGILMFNGTIKCCQEKPAENSETLV